MKNWITKSLYKSAGLFVLCVLPLGFPVYGESFVTMEELFDEGIEQSAPAALDPFEPVNRVIFKFNDFLYLNVFNPVARTYEWVTPDPLEKRFSNFFENLGTPVRLVGNILQGKWDGALNESGRFLLNSTIGIAGLHRPADEVSFLEQPPKEDIGQALGSWGFGDGPYILIPVLGPSSFRDLIGRVGDRAVDPFKLPFAEFDEWEVRTVYGVGGILVNSPSMVDRYKQMKGGALDPYIALRNGYFQYRDAAIKE
jgi:phospholipid-binding lipoprotein MlaA